ncbi:MAG: tRNA (N6-threonylcarbamoyladenosine(37)-N6)-methyltransferase TrmO [Bdellovibrionota bacterium]
MDLKYLENFNFDPIGFVDSCYKGKFGVPRQPGLAKSSTAKLKIRADLQPEESLSGLEGFSHIWLIFVFHQNMVSRFHAKVHPPRLEGKPMGLFATRTPHRPNPIGLSLVELVKIDKDTLEIRGIDLVDGTPILDIKPYMPEIEARPEATAGWTCGVLPKVVEVDFSPEAEGVLAAWQERSSNPNLREIIKETLSLDPRPLLYRGYEKQKSPYRDEHAFRLFDGDIHFKYVSPDKALVFKILS